MIIPADQDSDALIANLATVEQHACLSRKQQEQAGTSKSHKSCSPLLVSVGKFGGVGRME